MSVTVRHAHGERIPIDDGGLLLFGDAFASDGAQLMESLLVDVRWTRHRLQLFGKRIDAPRLSAWHAEPELGPAPVIASLSLGATRHFRLRRRGQTRTTLSLDLEGGSLLLMEAPLQQHWQHCIPKTRRQTGPRINLTWRQILPHSSSPVSLTRMGQ